MKNIIPSFKKSLFTDNNEILVDISEFTIDQLIESAPEIVDFPIIKTFTSVLKTAHNLYDRNLLKNTLIFIKELNSGNINKDKYIAYQSTINNDEAKCEKELGRVLLILNSTIDIEKAQILAKIFKEYINQKINWKEFCEYSEILNRMFIEDIDLLNKIYNENLIFENETSDEYYRVYRLNSVGLINMKLDKLTVGMIHGSMDLRQVISPNSIGNNFLKIIN